MSLTSISRCILWITLLSSCALIVDGKGGRGGGGRRGGSSRGGGWGSSSRSSSSSGGGGSSSFKYPSSSSSMSITSHHIPANIGDMNGYLARERARTMEALATLRNHQQSIQSVTNYRRQQLSRKPSVSFGSSQRRPVSYGIPKANYPRQPISSFRSISSHSSVPQPDVPFSSHPINKQTILIYKNPRRYYNSSPSQASISNANYPRQQNPHQTFRSSSQQGFQNANYPRQALNPNPSAPLVHSPLGHKPNQPSRATGLYSHPHSGIFNANYPRQQSNFQSLPPQVLGSGVWNPKSGMPAPVYMNYGGLPTGANMYTKPIKKQGFLGSLMSMGGFSKSYKNKHYGSYPNPYGVAGGMPANVLGGFMGNKGSKTAMYTILPYMAARKSSKLFKPKFGFYGYRPIRYHSYHHHSYMHDAEYARVHYDVYNNDYVGRCNRPIKPNHAKVVCNSTHNQVDCIVTCEESYRYPDNMTSKTNKCWHVSGTWNPAKNFPDCKPVCAEPCLNGGKCVSPGVCGCPSEYRGPRCESRFLNCDIRKLANGSKILWVCTHTKNETSCRVRCKPPAEFVSQSESLYKCTLEGVWTPSVTPLCVVPTGSEGKNVTKIPEDVTKVTP